MSDEVYVEFVRCSRSIVRHNKADGKTHTYHEYELVLSGDAWDNAAFAEKVDAAFHPNNPEDPRVVLNPDHSFYKSNGGGYDGRGAIRVIALATSPTDLVPNARDVFENAVKPILIKHGLARKTVELRHVYG